MITPHLLWVEKHIVNVNKYNQAIHQCQGLFFGLGKIKMAGDVISSGQVGGI
jgi:hypothetical protein